ncbi:DUF1801 domain-containing protein [Streptomyces sp. GD-15H]|uniref:DUF1801 domain-containing protein n=1 Tax=Streptomyces sp. GD-15H TaxID=3129112 RepID=UPI00325699FA
MQDVASRLAEVPGPRGAAPTGPRRLCRAELTGFTGVRAYGVPACERDGTAEIAFAVQKHYPSFHLLRGDVRAAFENRPARPAGRDMGKDRLRFRKPEDPATIDFDLVRDPLRATAAEPGPVC